MCLAFGVSFLAIPKGPKIAQSSASSIPLFSPRKPLLSFHRPSLVSLEQTAARTFPLSSLDSSVHSTKLVLSFTASSRACFLGSIMMSPLNTVLRYIISTGSTSAGSIECSMVISHASHSPFRVGRVFCVHIFSGSSPG